MLKVNEAACLVYLFCGTFSGTKLAYLSECLILKYALRMNMLHGEKSFIIIVYLRCRSLHFLLTVHFLLCLETPALPSDTNMYLKISIAESLAAWIINVCLLRFRWFLKLSLSLCNKEGGAWNYRSLYVTVTGRLEVSVSQHKRDGEAWNDRFLYVTVTGTLEIISLST